MSESHVYKVVFHAQNKVYEIYARRVSHGGLLGFVEVEELDFGRRSELVLDPSEERIKSEFEGVKRTFLPVHSIVRIDEVEKRGVSKISDARGANVTRFPYSVFSPGDQGGQGPGGDGGGGDGGGGG